MQCNRMCAEFNIIADINRGALRVTMGGFFSHADVTAFLAEVHAKLGQLRMAPNTHLMLCDVRTMKIQSQDIVAAFGQIVGDPRSRSKRLAFVTGSSLSRLQAKRLSNRDGIAYFADLSEAEDWLFDEAFHTLAAAAE